MTSYHFHNALFLNSTSQSNFLRYCTINNLDTLTSFYSYKYNDKLFYQINEQN